MSNYKPNGFQAITPYICVLDFSAFFQFVQDGLGAEVLDQQPDDNGVVTLATIKLDDSILRISGAWDAKSATPAMLYFYVPNVEAAYNKAIKAGAIHSEGGPNPFGDEQAVVTDRWNNFWWFAKQQ